MQQPENIRDDQYRAREMNASEAPSPQVSRDQSRSLNGDHRYNPEGAAPAASESPDGSPQPPDVSPKPDENDDAPVESEE